jgi:hypothetical protein
MPPRPLKPQLIFAALSARLEAAPLQKAWWSEFSAACRIRAWRL